MKSGSTERDLPPLFDFTRVSYKHFIRVHGAFTELIIIVQVFTNSYFIFKHELNIKPSLNTLLIPAHYSGQPEASVEESSTSEPMSPGPSN